MYSPWSENVLPVPSLVLDTRYNILPESEFPKFDVCKCSMKYSFRARTFGMGNLDCTKEALKLVRLIISRAHLSLLMLMMILMTFLDFSRLMYRK